MNTPTPRTDADERMAWDSEYMVPPETARELERELTAMTEQRDEAREETKRTREFMDHGFAVAQAELTAVTEQRDRLAEALRKAISWGDSASHHILYREKINWTYLNEAREALQSLTPKSQ